jgi:hypothetical protein
LCNQKEEEKDMSKRITISDSTDSALVGMLNGKTKTEFVESLIVGEQRKRSEQATLHHLRNRSYAEIEDISMGCGSD